MANTPINIAQLQRGDVVRIQLSFGNVLVPIQPGVAEVQACQVSRPYRKSWFVGFCTMNNFEQRVLAVDVTDTTKPDEHYLVEIFYKKIRVIEKQLQGSLVSDSVHRLRIPAYVPILGIF